MKFCHNLRRQKGQVAYLNPPAYSAWYDRNSLRGHRRSWPNCCKRANAEGSQLLSAPVHWSLLCAWPYRRAWQRSYRSARWNDSDTPRVSQCPIPRDRSTRRYIWKENIHIDRIVLSLFFLTHFCELLDSILAGSRVSLRSPSSLADSVSKLRLIMSTKSEAFFRFCRFMLFI